MLVVRDLQKSYAGQPVLKGLSFELEHGNNLAVLGSSGCGKTTMLQILAGLIQADAGQVILNGEDLTALRPEKRGLVYLSQEPLLFPHLDVSENIGFGLSLRGLTKPVIRERSARMLDRLGLAGMDERKPGSLSGGQKQRVAFGRALILEPAVLLLDEPFGSLDAATRGDMQAFYRSLSAELGTTTLFVTHDLKEALIMGDQLARMDQGRLTVYHNQQAFVQEPSNGVQQEWEFWRNLIPGC